MSSDCQVGHSTPAHTRSSSPSVLCLQQRDRVHIPQDLVKKQLVRMRSISEKRPHLLGGVMAGKKEVSCSPHAASFKPKQPMHMCREHSHKPPAN